MVEGLHHSVRLATGEFFNFFLGRGESKEEATTIPFLFYSIFI
jgi:hypothetical protein